jgi:hypothetical protein
MKGGGGGWWVKDMEQLTERALVKCRHCSRNISPDQPGEIINTTLSDGVIYYLIKEQQLIGNE